MFRHLLDTCRRAHDAGAATGILELDVQGGDPADRAHSDADLAVGFVAAVDPGLVHVGASLHGGGRGNVQRVPWARRARGARGGPARRQHCVAECVGGHRRGPAEAASANDVAMILTVLWVAVVKISDVDAGATAPLRASTGWWWRHGAT